MTRKSIGSLLGLGLIAIGACTGGGGPNDFGVGADDDAPWDPGAPQDPSAPPASTTDPPFGGVAPPPGDQPPSGGNTGGTGPGGGNCTALCNELAQACQPDASAAELAECVSDCEEVPGRCFSALRAYYTCAIQNDCAIQDACETLALEVVECVGPTPPGEGGQGNI